MTLVSLIMPVWQPRRDWLHEAVASALDEHACDIELIVVDDGNERPVSDLLADFDDPRLRLLRLDHCGPYATRNAALAVARGDYVRFVDADDIAEPGSTGRLLALTLQAGGETLAYGLTMMCDDQMRPTYLVSETAEGDVSEICVLGGFDVYVVAILYPIAVLKRAGPWPETGFRVSGDWDYVLRILEQAPVRRLDEVVAHYRRHSTSVTKSAGVADGVRAGLLVLEGYFSRHPDRRGSSLERRAYTNLHLMRARSYRGVGDLGGVCQQLLLAARRSPWAVISEISMSANRRLRRFASKAARRLSIQVIVGRIAPIMTMIWWVRGH